MILLQRTVPIRCAQAESTIDSLELATTAKRYTGSPRRRQEDPYDYDEGRIPVLRTLTREYGRGATDALRGAHVQVGEAAT